MCFAPLSCWYLWSLCKQNSKPLVKLLKQHVDQSVFDFLKESHVGHAQQRLDYLVNHIDGFCLQHLTAKDVMPWA